MKNMNRSDLVAQMAKEAEITLEQAEKAFTALTVALQEMPKTSGGNQQSSTKHTEQAAIDELSLEKLEVLKADVDLRISQKRKEMRKALFGQMQEIAKSVGFESVEAFLADHTGKRTTRSEKGISKPPKYRDPENGQRTWTGKGRKPNWVLAHLNAGGSVEELEIG